MKTKVWCIALAAGAFFAIRGHEAAAYSSGVWSDGNARCSDCHNGGPAPHAVIAAQVTSKSAPDGVNLKQGERTTLLLEVQSTPGKGLGLSIIVPAGFKLQALNSQTRVDRQVLAQQSVIPMPTGRLTVPFAITAEQGCGNFPIRADVTAADRNRSPRGDGAARATATLHVECAAGESAAPSSAAATARPRIVAGTEIAAPAVAPAVSAEAGNAARVAAPVGVLSAPTTVSVNHRRATGNHVQLDIVNQESIEAAPEPGLAVFKASPSRDAGRVHMYFSQGAGYVVVDCAMQSEKEIVMRVEAPSQISESIVSVADGHAVAVVPRTSVQRRVHVMLAGKGLKWSFSSCELTPVR